ncbi:hypothetical protein MVES_002800 [Malassezia vespertilionis]|uniref:L-serine ammonia-lyase n=1 Tax=Malassezia vespertilionis TaxID=2020962 RepID=A0A2N1J9T7_9BASI|nr:hypothetical protein MVES_002800 [Malassezia vespertilionis]
MSFRALLREEARLSILATFTRCSIPFLCASVPLRKHYSSDSQSTPESFSHVHFDTFPSKDHGSSHEGEPPPPDSPLGETEEPPPNEHAVISMFDLFSIGIGPSSSHTVGPMRAGAIFLNDLRDAGMLASVHRIKLALYGSLAATGKGHMTPQALLLGLEGADCETVDTESVPTRFQYIQEQNKLVLGKDTPQDGPPQEVVFDYERDLEWKWGQTLPMHSNGMRFSVFNQAGDLLATNSFYSIGGGFVVNGKMAVTDKPGPRDPSETTMNEQGEYKAQLEKAEMSMAEPVLHDSEQDLASKKGHPVDLNENVFYKALRRSQADGDRRNGVRAESVASLDKPIGLLPSGEERVMEKDAPKTPRFPFHNMASLLAITRKYNLTIAQVVYENELSWYTPEEIDEKMVRIWTVMDEGIRAGVLSEQETLPGSLRMKRRAPQLYAKLMRGLYMGPRRLGNKSEPTSDKFLAEDGKLLDEPRTASDGPQLPTRAGRTRMRPSVRGSFHHEVMPVPQRRPNFPAMDWLSCWAIATNEQVAAGGRIVIAPTLGAAGIIPSVLRYVVEFVAISPEDEENLVRTFLLTAAAIGMLFKRGATISAAEGGCMAEVGTSCSMAAAAFAACMGASPEIIEQAAETAIEHNLGLTCDPVDGLVQAPCIERNAVGSVKAVVSANLALSSGGVHSISLDEAIHAARLTAADMHMKYKETSLSGLATTVKIPVAVPEC